jgi:hypothetical protein
MAGVSVPFARFNLIRTLLMAASVLCK